MTSLLLSDLDGTLRQTKSGKTFINDPTDQKIIDGVQENLASHYSHWKLIGITNQGGVPKYKSMEIAIAEQKYTLSLLPQLEAIYFCPGFQGDQYWKVDRNGVYCGERRYTNPKTQQPISFRKPGHGMLLAAIEDVGHYAEILYIGDRTEDEQAALAANVPFLWASQWLKSM